MSRHAATKNTGFSQPVIYEIKMRGTNSTD
jgi:hypothetical protein